MTLVNRPKKKNERTIFLSTKADTLKLLEPLLKHSRIERTYIFRVGDWRQNTDSILSDISQQFRGKVVVRSSAVNEDGYHASKAGCYRSFLNISSNRRSALKAAIDGVIKSYEEKGDSNDLHQILIQAQTRGVRISGVLLTRNTRTGSPYYVVNYRELRT